jgi:hypothetical protein
LIRGHRKHNAQSIKLFIFGDSQPSLLDGQIVVKVIVLTLGVYLSELQASGELVVLLCRDVLDGVACLFSFSPITPDPFSVAPRDSSPPPQPVFSPPALRHAYICNHQHYLNPSWRIRGPASSPSLAG